jgi:hypothetical protein
MAQAYPEFGAGEGDTIGHHGTQSEWPYLVELDAEGDDPIAVLLTVAPPNSPHPDPRYNAMVVTDYRKDKQKNEKWWRIIVVFGSLSEQTLGQWRRSGHFGSETRQLEWSLGSFTDDGQFPTQGDQTVIDAPLEVGSRKYTLPATDGTTGPWTNEYATEGGKIKLNLVADAVDPSTGGIEVKEGILPLGYENIIPQLSIFTLKTLMSYAWTTNRFAWPAKTIARAGTYLPWTLVFTGMSFDDVVINLAGGVYWFTQVRVELLYKPISVQNPFGWRGVQRGETYTDPNGFRYPVFKVVNEGFKRIVKNHVTYPESNFGAMFGFMGGNPVI